MQNEYKSPTHGKITKIFVQEGAAVETGAPMVTLVAPEE
jgi:biotin carboxyl carrier protein